MCHSCRTARWPMFSRCFLVYSVGMTPAGNVLPRWHRGPISPVADPIWPGCPAGHRRSVGLDPSAGPPGLPCTWGLCSAHFAGVSAHAAGRSLRQQVGGFGDVLYVFLTRRLSQCSPAVQPLAPSAGAGQVQTPQAGLGLPPKARFRGRDRSVPVAGAARRRRPAAFEDTSTARHGQVLGPPDRHHRLCRCWRRRRGRSAPPGRSASLNSRRLRLAG